MKTKLNEELEMLEPESHITFFESDHISRNISVYLDEEIKTPKYYRPLLQVIESLSESDSLSIKVNTYGGSLDGATAIIQAMNSTPADVTVTLEGRAASAGSLICLAAPNLIVGPYADVMIHQGSFGSAGTQSNIISHTAFEDSRIKKIMQTVYEGFLTEEELKNIFMGVEMWFDFDEIMKRLDKRNELMQEKYNKSLEEELPDTEDPLMHFVSTGTSSMSGTVKDQPRVISPTERSVIIKEAVEAIKPKGKDKKL